jgi:hypothetical protein
VALGTLALGWFWLATIDVDGSLPAQLTFWDALGALGTGAYRLVALVCVAAPLLICTWNDRRAHLAAALPLAFMLAVALPLADLARQTSGARPELVSPGAGAYLAVLAGLYLALTGAKRFLVAAARDATVFYENE